MERIETPLNGVVILKPRIFEDSRGYFFESYNKNTLSKLGIDIDFVQDNVSKSGYGVIRGLHYQKEPFAQTKLLRVLRGRILDVAVDVRKGSPTFSKHFSVELSEENSLQLLIPKGFAHGFSVLSNEAVVMYKCDNYYNKESEGGLIYNDSELNIDWKIPKGKENVSEKDLLLPTLRDAAIDFGY